MKGVCSSSFLILKSAQRGRGGGRLRCLVHVHYPVTFMLMDLPCSQLIEKKNPEVRCVQGPGDFCNMCPSASLVVSSIPLPSLTPSSSCLSPGPVAAPPRSVEASEDVGRGPACVVFPSAIIRGGPTSPEWRGPRRSEGVRVSRRHWGGEGPTKRDATPRPSFPNR